jgi:hypothetical protein
MNQSMTHLRTLFLLASSALVLVCGGFFLPSANGQSSQKRVEWRSAVLEVVTNFDKADIKVNGLAYPEYRQRGEPEGMVLPAGGPHVVEVTYDGKTKTYRLNLRPEETRLLIVELSGFQGGGAARPTRTVSRRPEPKEEKKEEKEEKGQGRVTVYSKPKGMIMIDGGDKGEKTPGTVDVEPGRHEVQVNFEDGEESEKKIIRVRKGSRIKLFFRQKKDK